MREIAATITTVPHSGRFLEFPSHGQPGSRPINALYATLLRATGQPLAGFNPDATSPNQDEFGPLAEMMG